jgi:magnesium-transporting ATPase (P-type)
MVSVLPDLGSAPEEAVAPGQISQPESHWHAQAAGDVLAALKTGPDGLTAQEAKAREEHYGPNRLAATPKRSEILRFLAQFNNVLIYVLLGAAALAMFIGHIVDAVVVLAVALLNATIGYVQEGRAERALDAIRAQAVIVPMQLVSSGFLALLPGARRTLANRAIYEQLQNRINAVDRPSR